VGAVFLGSEPSSAKYVRSHAVRAGDIMNREATLIAANASLAEVAWTFEAARCGDCP